MNRKQYEVGSLPEEIVIGRQTETGVMAIRIDCTGWLTFWPGLALSIWATPPGGSAAYPAKTHMEGNVLVWDVNNSDTAVSGVGTMEIVGIASGKKKLSAIAKTRVERTTTIGTTTPPEAAKAWVDDVMQAAGDAKASKNQAASYAKSAEESAKKAEESAASASVSWDNLTGKPSAFPPATHGHTMSEVDGLPDELSQLKNDKLDKTATAADSVKLGGVAASDYALKTDTAPDSSKLGGKAPEYYLQPRNLLDNSDFTNLVAQARIGGNHGAVAYAADRWILDSGTVSYEAGVGLTLSGTIRQKLEFPPNRETSVFVGMASGAASISYADGAVTITSSGGIIKWAALYEGAFTAENLPPYVPKGYAAELAECRLYYRPQQMYCLYCYSGGYAVGINFEPMRSGVIPTPVNAKAQTMTGDNVAGETTIFVTQIDRVSYVANPNFAYGNYYRVFSEFSSDL